MKAIEFIKRSSADFKMWFTLKHSPNTWNIISENKIVGELIEDEDIIHLYPDDRPEDGDFDWSCDLNTNRDDILEEFLKFKSSRPEYWVGKKCELPASASSDELNEKYQEIMLGVALIRAKNNDKYSEEAICDKFDRYLNWINSTDFMSAPASTIYHGSFESGLIRHSMDVMNRIIDLFSLECFSNRVSFNSAVLAALTHDWCKINSYESYLKNVKNETTGQWEKVKAYRHKDAFCPIGHGVGSMYMVEKFFKLTTEEAIAIRWHMGRWHCCESEMNDLQQANENYPLVHMLQFADQLSITNY